MLARARNQGVPEDQQQVQNRRNQEVSRGLAQVQDWTEPGYSRGPAARTEAHSETSSTRSEPGVPGSEKANETQAQAQAQAGTRTQSGRRSRRGSIAPEGHTGPLSPRAPILVISRLCQGARSLQASEGRRQGGFKLGSGKRRRADAWPFNSAWTTV
ncbi:hypothetical protein NDU88_001735 [Pleurodeles waltl]|uniref:Uncharacterized protein n=1 Tax=Pleurodeles waltl TaxID=8319 RepID=A0AAV7R7Z0_PLEWA|nr:hypothetical protein NDU88_001735 [Pleurodeles waltl]